jgi:uncharacterized membrane protein YvlD (DUF360 family)
MKKNEPKPEKRMKIENIYSQNPEGTLSIAAAILLIFSAMINPVFSAGLAIGIILAYGIYKFVIKK